METHMAQETNFTKTCLRVIFYLFSFWLANDDDLTLFRHFLVVLLKVFFSLTVMLSAFHKRTYQSFDLRIPIGQAYASLLWWGCVCVADNSVKDTRSTKTKQENRPLIGPLGDVRRRGIVLFVLKPTIFLGSFPSRIRRVLRGEKSPLTVRPIE